MMRNGRLFGHGMEGVIGFELRAGREGGGEQGRRIPDLEPVDPRRNAPGAAEAIVRLYRAFAEQRDKTRAALIEGGQAADAPSPADWVRDHVQSRANYFPELDGLGETLVSGGLYGRLPLAAAGRPIRGEAWRSGGDPP
jgi:hypothetical protein